MGTSVAPTYANIFMGWLEEKILHSFRLQPLVYLRYLDDIFITWPHGRSLLQTFIDHANFLHNTIKFTANISNSEIAFLDVLIRIENHKPVTTLYKKSINLRDFENCVLKC